MSFIDKVDKIFNTSIVCGSHLAAIFIHVLL